MLRGQVAAGVNSYLPLPLFDKNRHLPFHDADTWNDKARHLNSKYEKEINEAFSAH